VTGVDVGIITGVSVDVEVNVGVTVAVTVNVGVAVALPATITTVFTDVAVFIGDGPVAVALLHPTAIMTIEITTTRAKMIFFILYYLLFFYLTALSQFF
jgi:hypothetical protein